MKSVRTEILLYLVLAGVVAGVYFSGLELAAVGSIALALFFVGSALYLLWWSFEPYLLALVGMTLIGVIRGWDREERQRQLAALSDFDHKMLDWGQVGRKRDSQEENRDG